MSQQTAGRKPPYCNPHEWRAYLSTFCSVTGNKAKYLLHEFVIMPNHFHLLLTPGEVTLERSMQFIKGGFSLCAGKEFGIRREIWQTSFVDRRVRDANEYEAFKL